MSRFTACIVAAALAMSLSPSASASLPPDDPEMALCARTNAPAEGARFEVTGPGAQTFVGGWLVDGKDASLCFRGAGGLGGATSILMSWRTPWIHSQAPEFEDSFTYRTANPTDAVTMRVELRSRFAGGSWGGWFSFKHSAEPPVSEGGGVSGAGVAVFSTGRPPTISMQWEWRLRMDLAASAAVDMTASMHTGP